MDLRGSRRSTGQNKRMMLRENRLHPVDLTLEGFRVGFCDPPFPGIQCRKVCAEVEKLTLQTQEDAVRLCRRPGREGDAKDRVHLVQPAIRRNKWMTFRNTLAGKQTRLAGIARSRVDFHFLYWIARSRTLSKPEFTANVRCRPRNTLTRRPGKRENG
jgi:hypothetical protein